MGWIFAAWISRAMDKLPRWAKGICGVLIVLLSVYCIYRDGFWLFLLKMIF